MLLVETKVNRVRALSVAVSYEITFFAVSGDGCNALLESARVGDCKASTQSYKLSGAFVIFSFLNALTFRKLCL
jgi:hypothetical protein